MRPTPSCSGPHNVAGTPLSCSKLLGPPASYCGPLQVAEATCKLLLPLQCCWNSLKSCWGPLQIAEAPYGMIRSPPCCWGPLQVVEVPSKLLGPSLCWWGHLQAALAPKMLLKPLQVAEASVKLVRPPPSSLAPKMLLELPQKVAEAHSKWLRLPQSCRGPLKIY